MFRNGVSLHQRSILPRRAETAIGWAWCFRVRGAKAASTPLGASGPGARTPKMARVEAALFVADSALSPRRLFQVATLADQREAREIVDLLNASYDESGSAFRIEWVATGYQMLTRPEYAPWLDRIHHRQASLRLTGPASETLAIIAYRQPVTRADIEAVRGVQSAEIIKQLMDRGLVRIVGEEDSLGKPYLYGTTRRFLESFGLRNLADLPMNEGLAGLLREKEVETVEASMSDDVGPVSSADGAED